MSIRAGLNTLEIAAGISSTVNGFGPERPQLRKKRHKTVTPTVLFILVREIIQQRGFTVVNAIIDSGFCVLNLAHVAVHPKGVAGRMSEPFELHWSVIPPL